MGMQLGDNLKVTLFGESHGKCVGALVEGVPAGTPLDTEILLRDLLRRNLEERASPRDPNRMTVRYCPEFRRGRQPDGRS